MGVACPHLSDETCYTMVESSVGGSCRCACQEDYTSEDNADGSSGCCSPQVFTSVLLGILACVLMTGGVFLAFHRWDPLWLIVSGVGVILILIGSILHCCSNRESRAKRDGRKSVVKGCCGRPVQTDHLHNHLVANNGSLTEQLLPLSNARSVSQLSLNMLPGYFPPVVTTYGIEQHSAVVQNINRLVQQQQLQQQAQSPGSASPGVTSGAGKSFILLSLPGDTTQANIQNLVATVYQLDGNSVTDTTATDITSTASPDSGAVPVSPASLILKSVEVQTCNIWPNMAPNSSSVIGINSVQNCASSSSTGNASTEYCNNPIEPQRPSTSTASGMTQTEDLTPPISEEINLMDCSSDIPPVCDNNAQGICGSQTLDHNALMNIPASTSSVLVDVSESSVDVASTTLQSALVVAIPESSTNNLLDIPTSTTAVLLEVADATVSCSADVPGASSDVLIDICSSTADQTSGTSVPQLSEVIVNNVVPTNNPVSSNNDVQELQENTSNSVQSESVLNNIDVMNQLQIDIGSSEPSLSCSNLSEIDVELDDNELPPSYDDVALEGENAVGAFGLAYGTI